jgi:hypothetical protein
VLFVKSFSLKKKDNGITKILLSSGICKYNICNQHLRKKRKDKNGVWARICDDCEDKYLF